MHSESNQEPTRSPKTGHWLDHWLLLVLLAACCVAMSNNGAEPDLWGHIQYGRDALAHGLPEFATYSYTAEGFPWINHENLSEIALAVGYDWLGMPGLLVAKCLFGVLILGLVIHQSKRQGAGQFATYGTVLLTAANLVFFWVLRPQLFSFVFFTLLLALLSWCFEGWEGEWWLRWPRRRSDDSSNTEESAPSYSIQRLRCLWLAPVLLFVWANTHGAFAAGLAVFCVYLGCRSIEAVSCRGRSAIGLVKRFGLMIAASILATFVNPYGPHLHKWMLKSLAAPRPEIIEWLPPELDWTVQSLAWVPFWILLAIAVAALIWSRRPRDFTQLVILGCILVQALEHRRHIALFAILAAMWLPGHIAALLRRVNVGVQENSLAALPRLWRRGLTALLLAATMLVGNSLSDQLQLMVVRRESYPVSAFQYIADRQFQGPMVVAFNWAQYAIMAFGAESPGDRGLRVAFDGRYDTCYPFPVVDMQFDWEMGVPEPGARYRCPQSPPPDGRRILEFGTPDLVLLDRNNKHSVEMIDAVQANWVLLYQDELAQLWGRSTKFDNPNSPDFVPLAQRKITEDPQRGYVAWPALPVRGRAVSQLAQHRTHAQPPLPVLRERSAYQGRERVAPPATPSPAERYVTPQ